MGSLEKHGGEMQSPVERPDSVAPVSISEAETRRSAERNSVSYVGIVQTSAEDPVQVNLVDLSTQGARMILPEGYEPPDQVILGVLETNARFLAEIVWRQDRTCGVRFLNPVGDD